MNNVGQDHKDKPAIVVEVGSDRVSAQVSEGALARLGDAVAWLAPKHSAKVKITAALAESVAIKIKSHEALDDQDEYFVSAMFHKEARKLANQEAVAQRVGEVLPEVQDRVRLLPPYRDRGTSRAFLGRAESIAAEITEDEFRDLFAGRFGSVGICGGYGRFQPEASLPCHIHKFDESITIVEGEAVCLVQGKRYRLSGCDTAFVPEGRPHRFLNHSDSPMAMIWVYAGTEPERSLVRPAYCDGTLVWPESDHNEI